jgi:hypothetical protein
LLSKKEKEEEEKKKKTNVKQNLPVHPTERATTNNKGADIFSSCKNCYYQK